MGKKDYHTKMVKLGRLFRFKVYLLIFVLMGSFAGNAYACLFPFSVQLNKTAMKCETSESLPEGAASQSDEDCNSVLLFEGSVSHFNTSAQTTLLRLGQPVSAVSPLVSQSCSYPQESSRLLIHRSDLDTPAAHSVPIYTATHSFLI